MTYQYFAILMKGFVGVMVSTEFEGIKSQARDDCNS
jgi:hypothetical protein